MIFQTVIPILYSKDVAKSLNYYVEVLEFDRQWGYDDPPNFGGVVKNSVELFFCKEGQGHPGTWICIMMNNLDVYYESIKNKGVKIHVPPVDREWGLREMLVEDPDGHIIRFGQPAKTTRQKSEELPNSIRIVPRLPTAEEMHRLSISVGWSKDENAPGKAPSPGAIAYAVVAEDIASNAVVGTAWLLGDKAGFYYLRNVAVHKDYQNKRVGTAIMQAITDWLDEQNTEAYIGLHTGENLIPFYKQFGFEPACGMRRMIKGRKK